MVWGGWEGHEPKQCVDVFAPFLEEQSCEVRIENALDVYPEEYMNSFSLIVPVWTMGDITNEQAQGLLLDCRLCNASRVEAPLRSGPGLL